MSRPDPLQVLPYPERPSSRHLDALSQAARQLEIADLYLAAAENLDTGDRPLQRALRRLRGELGGTRRDLLARLG